MAAIAAAVLVAGGALAQDYPGRAITLVVPFAVGSGIDPTARIIADELSRSLKQPVVIDYKPGANGAIAAGAVARATPDGYTIFMTTVSTHSANPNLLKSIPYDPIRDFAPLSRVGNLPFMLVVDPKMAATSVPEFVAYVKANPGRLSYASTNAIGLLAGATLKRMADLDLVHVPYRSSPQALNDVMTGRVAMMFVDFALGWPQAKAGNVRALAVTTKERSALMPDVPSMTEAGLPAFDLIPWNAIFAPANTPKPIVQRLNGELRRIITDPQVKERLAGLGFDAFASTPEELDAFVREDLAKWTKWVREAGIEPE
ncbi:MAG TPA: tripartite tricarboxylate transporter substrate binding protein [Xanthobacteraceae bacterium]|nr:tripartite tricarboxylate transporter substrate binding protein [Xanthobacteraceae bacterium]